MTVEMGLLNIDSIIIAHQLGATALGFYALAFNVSSWPSTIITNAVRKVSIAALNRMVQAGEDWRAAFARSLSLLIALLVPVCVLLGALARPLVEFLYSTKSVPAAPVLAWLVVLGGIRVTLGFVLDLLIAHGKTHATLRAELLWLVAAVPALWFGAELGGIRGVAIGHVLAAALVAAPVFLLEARRVGATLKPVGADLARPALGAAAGVVVAALLVQRSNTPIVQLALAGSATIVAYVLVAVPRHKLGAVAARARHRLAG
ncbi:MAG: oligosaccharide flippase family protein [Acidimicrobiia bacterium]|nr:oligosaccharide flippase family protein [Acidimicrobiia bacterium]